MGMPRKLHDFYVKLAVNGAEYKSFVQRSPAGQGEGCFTPPVQRTELEPLRQKLSGAIPASGHPRDVKPAREEASPYQAGTIGKGLGNGLFTGEVELLHVRSLGAIQSKPQEGLRLSIHLNLADPEIAWLGQLPWELIRDGHHYLLLDPKYSLARCLDLPGPPAPANIKQPLKVLVVLATPNSAPQLAAESEYRELNKSFSKSPSVQVRLLERATPEALGQAVREETFHVVHLVGHAGFDAGSGKGHLLFETASHGPNPVDAEQLADLLHGQATPQLLVLNACETASFSWRDGQEPWSGLATALLVAGFPAVVAMQFPITDKAAVAFSRGFYGLLAAGYRVDLAVTGGRQAIFVENHSSLEWATPVLFLRGMEGNIFRVETPRPRQRTVVIKVHGERQDIPPQYEDRLVDELADFLEIAPTDVESVYAESGRGRFTIRLPADAAKRLLEAAKSSQVEFAALSISSIQATETWSTAPTSLRLSSAAIILGLGLLGNLLAALLQKELLRDSFTLPRIVSLLVLSIAFLYWGLFARIRRGLGLRPVIATLIACVALLACFALPAMLVSPHSDCGQVSRVELDVPVAHPLALSLSGDHVTDIKAQDLRGIQHLSGRAVLSNPGPSCLCDWSGKTDRDQSLTDLHSSTDCAFTIDLPGQYTWIYLQLRVGRKTDLFIVHVK
jgi:hypothetical protein